MRYLIIAMPGCGNLGDDLISTLLQKKIVDRDHSAEIGVLCGEYSSFECIGNTFKLLMPRNIPSLYWNRKKQIIQYIKECDYIFVGGGGLFQDSHSVFTVHKYLHWLYYAKCPVYCVGIGVGPINHEFNIRYLKRVLNRPGISVRVRDSESYNLLSDYGLNNIVLGCDIVEGSNIGLSKMEHEGNILGCSVRKWVDVDITKIADIINVQISQKKITKVLLFVFEYTASNIEEYEFLSNLSNFINCDNEIVVYGRDKDFYKKLTCVDYAIASRYHANIIWQKLGVIVIPIPYAPKVYSLYHKAGYKLTPFDSMHFECNYISLDIQENFVISEQFSGTAIRFSILEKINNKMFEYICFVVNILKSIYLRIATK